MPKLTVRDLKDIKALELKYFRLRQNILEILVQPCNGNSREYKVYIDCVPESTRIVAFRRHYCAYRVGALNVGCCSNLKTVVYYLCDARHHSRTIEPAGILNSLILDRSVVLVIEEDSDD